MSDANLSKAAAEAVQFLSSVYDDLQAMLASLEAAMDQAGWKPTEKKMRDMNLTPTLQGDWILSWGYRFYTPKSSDETFKRLIAVVWSFNPPDTREIDFAALTVAAARFPRPVTFTEVYDSWESTWPVTLIGLSEKVASVVPPATYKSLFPHASAVAVVAAPLCSFTGEADLRARIVDPILAAEKVLGVKS